MQDEIIEEQKDLREHLAFVGRQFWPMLIAAVIIALVTVAVAILLPPVYRSTATILIEEQEIPTDLVRTTISSYADQRIQVISQQVMTRSNLMQIVDKYDLYVRERKLETTEEILERMRKDIKLDLVTADVIDRRSGNRTSAAIAFTLSFDSESPEKAQKVANELVSLYLNENLKNRKQQVEETSSFLAEESVRLGAHISEIESRLADFKKRNVGRLPELAQLNLQLRDRADGELADVERQLQGLEERRFYLEAQLAQMKPNSPIISSSGERILDSTERLRALQAQYAGLAGVYNADHPDLLRMRGEMEALRKEAGQTDSAAEIAKQIDKLRVDRAALRERYAEDHPDVTRLDRSIASLEQSLADRPATSAAPARKPENPSFIAMQSQLDALGIEHKATLAKRAELKIKRGQYEARLEQTPQVEREYLDLSRDHENSVSRYREIKNKLMEAQVAQELEKDAKSERFSLIDPPQFPEKPRSPNRPAILLIGLVAALGGGAGCAGVLEGLDGSVKNPRQLMRTLPAPLLSVIPYIVNDRERARRRWRRVAIGMAVLSCFAAVLAAIHYFWMPLEVFWYYLLRRLMLN
ncbi:MAG: Wzz/FepE/Etk N-terminal domain-containing protein [Burkholderiales bacterium]